MANKESSNKNLRGIGGWLLFFVIITGFSVVYNPISVVSSYINPLTEVGIVWILTAVISWLLSLSIFILIFTKKSWVPKYIITIIWLQFILGLNSLSSVKLNASSSIESTALLGGVILGLVISLIWAIIWNIYFVKSQRVKNTFVN